jgi:hypothetical protein
MTPLATPALAASGMRGRAGFSGLGKIAALGVKVEPSLHLPRAWR